MFLRITGVRAEKIQDISYDACIAEGALLTPSNTMPNSPLMRFDFKDLWDRTYGVGAWDRNDWVWVNEFERVDKDEINVKV